MAFILQLKFESGIIYEPKLKYELFENTHPN